MHTAQLARPFYRCDPLPRRDAGEQLAVPILPVRAADPPLGRPEAAHRDAHARLECRAVDLLRGACRQRARARSARRGRADRADTRLRGRADGWRVQEDVQPARRTCSSLADGESEGSVLRGPAVDAPAWEQVSLGGDVDEV